MGLAPFSLSTIHDGLPSICLSAYATLPSVRVDQSREQPLSEGR